MSNDFVSLDDDLGGYIAYSQSVYNGGEGSSPCRGCGCLTGIVCTLIISVIITILIII